MKICQLDQLLVAIFHKEYNEPQEQEMDDSINNKLNAFHYANQNNEELIIFYSNVFILCAFCECNHKTIYYCVCN